MILIGIMVLLGVVYFWLFFLPLQKEIKKRDVKLSQLLIQTAEKEAIAQNLAAFRKECENLELKLQAAVTQLPSKREIHALLQNISNLGRESGMEMPYFKPGASTKKDFYAEVPVDIKLLGSYHDFLGFLYRLGKLPRIVNMKDIKVKAAIKEDSRNKLEVTCKATTYRFLDESERAPPFADLIRAGPA